MTSLAEAKPLGDDEVTALVTWAIEAAVAWAEETGMPEDEITSEVINALHRALRRHEAGGTTVSDYVRRRVDGALLDASRKEKRRRRREVFLGDLEEARGQPVEDHDDALARATGVEGFAVGSPEAGVLRDEMQAALDGEVERLPRGDRLLYVLRYREELTWDDISARTGIPRSTAQLHDKLIRERLTAALRARYDEE
jgi:RNA polymerase sigma factor (sigma-70 family)